VEVAPNPPNPDVEAAGVVFPNPPKVGAVELVLPKENAILYF